MAAATRTGEAKVKRRGQTGVRRQDGAGTFLEAAAVILSRAKEPLSGKEITARALALGLLQDSEGKTPERTMTSALYMDVGHNSASRFRRIAKAGPIRAVRNSVKWALR